MTFISVILLAVERMHIVMLNKNNTSSPWLEKSYCPQLFLYWVDLCLSPSYNILHLCFFRLHISTWITKLKLISRSWRRSSGSALWSWAKVWASLWLFSRCIQHQKWRPTNSYTSDVSVSHCSPPNNVVTFCSWTLDLCYTELLPLVFSEYIILCFSLTNTDQMLKKVVRLFFLRPREILAPLQDGMRCQHVQRGDSLWNQKWVMHCFSGAWGRMPLWIHQVYTVNMFILLLQHPPNPPLKKKKRKKGNVFPQKEGCLGEFIRWA